MDIHNIVHNNFDMLINLNLIKRHEDDKFVVLLKIIIIIREKEGQP